MKKTLITEAGFNRGMLEWVQWMQLHPQILRLTTSAPTLFRKIIGKFGSISLAKEKKTWKP